MYARLGAVDDPMADDFSLASSGLFSTDPRDVYLSWVSAVKQFGGTVAAAPHLGKYAARYPFDVIYPNGATLNTIFHRAPDDWSADSAYGYYVAPAAVLQYVASGMVAAQSVPGESAPASPTWATQIQETLKAGGWIVGGIAALAALSFFRGRD